MDQMSFISPIGRICLKADNTGLVSIEIGGKKGFSKISRNRHLKKAAHELKEYFQGKRRKFTVSLSVSGTPFQMRVWNSLSKIKYGQLVCYADIAKMVKSPKAVRAVGLANKKNPLPIIVPCHRVVNKSGKLGGYNLGINRKKWLLRHENALSA